MLEYGEKGVEVGSGGHQNSVASSKPDGSWLYKSPICRKCKCHMNE